VSGCCCGPSIHSTASASTSSCRRESHDVIRRPVRDRLGPTSIGRRRVQSGERAPHESADFASCAIMERPIQLPGSRLRSCERASTSEGHMPVMRSAHLPPCISIYSATALSPCEPNALGDLVCKQLRCSDCSLTKICEHTLRGNLYDQEAAQRMSCPCGTPAHHRLSRDDRR
jgi:hypothetical protein